MHQVLAARLLRRFAASLLVVLSSPTLAQATLDCPADLDGDGVVGPADLTLALGAWGTTDADLDGDGIVGSSDLAILLGAWGACPTDPCLGEPTWIPTFGGFLGVDGTVFALAVADGASGAPMVYVGGAFSSAEGRPASSIALWRPESHRPSEGDRAGDESGLTGEWSALGSGVNGTIRALCMYDDGLGGGPALYAGGTFTVAGGVPAQSIARWDGQAWSSVGDGVVGEVQALAVFDDGSGRGPLLVAGGLFTAAGGEVANNIASWDGRTWSPLGAGTNAMVQALLAIDDAVGQSLIVGGAFAEAGGVEAKAIARWDGRSWSPVGSGFGTGSSRVFALATFDDGRGAALYAGGSFTAAGGVPMSRIARWDGLTWSPLGSGVNDFVHALAVFDDGQGGGEQLYVGGWFNTAGGSSVQNIARWNGRSWSSLGSSSSSPGVNYGVRALAALPVPKAESLEPPQLYVGGIFTFVGTSPAPHIVRWVGLPSGADWAPVGRGLNDQVWALASMDERDGAEPSLYVGGLFTYAGGEQYSNIAKWSVREGRGDWSSLSEGLNGGVRALIVFDDGSGGGPALYAGGDFTHAGSEIVNRVAKWDGRRWTPLGGGTNATVNAFAVFDDGSGSGPALHVGGAFTLAGGVTVNGVAKWDGVGWSPLGFGASGAVNALAVFDDGDGPALYVGGLFTVCGGLIANGIARWDGEAWSALGSGMSYGVSFGVVFAIAEFDAGDGSGPALYVGGWFNKAGGVNAVCIARWKGAAWSAVGGGVDGGIGALRVFDDGSGSALYAGGSFTIAGGTQAKHVARWDGVAWGALEAGVGPTARALVVHDDGAGGGPALYVGGEFVTSAGGDARLAKWGCPPLKR